MKNTILCTLSALLISLFACTDKSVNPNMIIKGQVPQDVEKVVLSQRKGMMQMVAETSVQENGEFIMEVPVTLPTYYTLSFGSSTKYADIYAGQGDEVIVNVTDEDIKFSGDRKSVV